jgi:hypothetical protein
MAMISNSRQRSSFPTHLTITAWVTSSVSMVGVTVSMT